MKEVFSQVAKENLKNPISKTNLKDKDFLDNKKVQDEIKNVEKKISAGETKIFNEKNELEDIKLFQSRLNKYLKSNQYSQERQNQLKKLQNSDLMKSVGMDKYEFKFDRESDDEDVKRQLAALLDLIRETKKNIAALDKYWISLLTGKGSLNSLAKIDSRFIKVADLPTEEEILEPVEDYYDDLYDDSEGSPNYGKILTHPEKYHHTLTTDASTAPKPLKFKKV